MINSNELTTNEKLITMHNIFPTFDNVVKENRYIKNQYGVVFNRNVVEKANKLIDKQNRQRRSLARSHCSGKWIRCAFHCKRLAASQLTLLDLTTLLRLSPSWKSKG